MRIASALVFVLLWSAVAAAQQFEEETVVPTPSGGPIAPGMPPPPGAPTPPAPGAPTPPTDDFAPPPASEMPAASARPEAPPPGSAPTIPKTDGPNVVKVHKDELGYQLLVDGKPTMVFGMNWGYMPIGQNYTYDFWGKPDEVIIKALDAEMRWLKDMHVNVIRQYLGIPPRWITYVYEKYGIYTVINHDMGRYGMRIDDVWVNPVDYSNERFRELVKEQITELVGQYKDTPGLLMWLLGNENNYGLYWKSSEIEDLPEAKQGDARASFLYSLFGEVTDLNSLPRPEPSGIDGQRRPRISRGHQRGMPEHRRVGHQRLSRRVVWRPVRARGQRARPPAHVHGVWR